MNEDSAGISKESVWVSTQLDVLGLPERTTGPGYTPVVPRSRQLGCRLPAPGPGWKTQAQTSFITEDGTTYYLLTPSVWGWVCRTMRSAGTVAASGQTCDAANYGALQARFEQIRRWINLTYSVDEIAAGIADQKPLPAVETARQEVTGDTPSPTAATIAPRDVTDLDPTVLAALERFSAERVAEGDSPDFADGNPVVMVEREVFLVAAPDWLASSTGPWLTFSGDGWRAIQKYREMVRDRREMEERQQGKQKEERVIRKTKAKTKNLPPAG